MTSGITSHDDAVLNAAASSFVEHSGKWTSTYKRLESIVEDVEDVWQGNASKAFRDAAAQLQDAAAKTAQELHEISQKLHTAGVSYTSTEENNATRLNVDFKQG